MIYETTRPRKSPATEAVAVRSQKLCLLPILGWTLHGGEGEVVVSEGVVGRGSKR